MTSKKPAVVLLSGGLDSATVLAIARSEGFETYALSFFYGQRHRWELNCASRVAKQLGVTQHQIIDVDLAKFGGSALTDNIAVPEQNEVAADEIPVTYVPTRNTVFLSLALAWAEALGSTDIFIGANAVDYSGYPDCRPEYIAAYEAMANLATKAGVEGRRLRIHVPLIELTKAQIIQRGLDLGVDYAHTSTCYRPTDDGAACGTCPACHFRLGGFKDVGTTDPVPYQAMPQGM